ncbi:alpha/beta fold hydrolase [Clostridium fungisolvens]|uniref:2-succinyl-6-hydroxy-2,4-cyclohexadiene-1-carboxylate synthase n=1 Tax=Clostridium fungisolvens TaxID=1604897 RepID=A0A6V8SIV0_9CLOT|nr:alpha/beta hydrolase [Clostridium fungisolvens]GFP76445.1 2-succinyl-6-hydroxy-2,4-cyclohexadiene-1-carboxylate synthase [Clostridium fungisolvens]
MYYDEYGNRENHTIIFLHGAAATDTFCNQYCFQDKYHLVVPHLYGSGKEVEEIYEPEKTIKALAELIKGLGKDKVTLIGHSLGGELAVAMVSQYEYLFDKAVFLSAWVCSTQKSIDKYVKISKYSSFTLKFSWLIRLQAKYWHYTKQQEDFMVEYSKKITPEQYTAWFKNRILLDDNTNYPNVNIPMLAVCGKKEIKEMKTSIEELGKRNPNCKTIFLDNANHDFPLRKADVINPILLDFI